MFVLCPHCHFLVGMDPRTGGPPAACPKCGGTVVEPVAANPPVAPPLDPFAQAALPSVAPTLPPVEVEDATSSVEASVPPATATRPVDAADAAPASATTVPVTTVPVTTVPTTAASATAASAPADPAMADSGTATAPEEGPVATHEPPATGKAAQARPSADEMIAALATRPARKPRAPRARTRKPAPTADVDAPGADAGTTPPPAPPAPPSAPAVAPTFGARLRRLFARAPRQADAAKQAETTPSVAPEAPPVADAAPATPPLSIRNRRRRAAARAPGSPEVAAGEVPASVPLPDEAAVPSGASPPASTTTPATAPASAVSTPTEVLEPVSTPAATSPEEAAPAPGPSVDEAAGADTTTGLPGSPDATVAPPENIDAAAAALVAAMPAPAGSAPPPTRPAPSFARPAPAAAGARRDHRAVAAAVALAGLLGLQLLLAQRAVLAADPGWRPTIAAVCTALRCELPPWREPAAFTMLNRHVRPHPDAPGTLLIDASFRNDARWPQPWPRLELALADVDGRIVGARTFEVHEYLGAAPTQAELAPGQAASLSLAVVEPAPDIVSFTFDFR